MAQFGEEKEKPKRDKEFWKAYKARKHKEWLKQRRKDRALMQGRPIRRKVGLTRHTTGRNLIKYRMEADSEQRTDV